MNRFSILTIFFISLLLLSSVSPVFAQTVEHPERIYTSDSVMSKLMSSYFKVEENQVVSIGQNCHYLDDVAVNLFLSVQTGADPQTILNQRIRGKSWAKIMEELKFHPSQLFTSVGSGSVTQEYSHVYNEYYKWQRDKSYKMVIYDKEVRNLVMLKFMVNRFSQSPAQIMKEKAKSQSFTDMILNRMIKTESED